MDLQLIDITVRDKQAHPRLAGRMTGHVRAVLQETVGRQEQTHELVIPVWADIQAGASDADIEKLLRPIQLWGTEEGWRKIDAMSDADQVREQNAIALSVRALHKYWLDRRDLQAAPIRRSSPKVGRNDPCPCGSGKKYKHCCLQ